MKGEYLSAQAGFVPGFLDGFQNPIRVNPLIDILDVGMAAPEADYNRVDARQRVDGVLDPALAGDSGHSTDVQAKMSH